jgi:hypothetical protein
MLLEIELVDRQITNRGRMESVRDQWRRHVIEAVVIAASILSAFAIDAWWDARQEQNRARVEIESLKVEFSAVAVELDRATAELDAARTATQQLARLAGPNPSPLSGDSLARLLTIALTVNAVELPTGALANLLSSGDLPILNNLPLQSALASWPSLSSLMSTKFGSLVDDRTQAIIPEMNRRIAVSKILSASFGGAWTDDHQFPLDATPLLESREFESLMSERWMGISIAAITVTDAQKLVGLINKQLADWK